MPAGFVRLEAMDPTIRLAMRYVGRHNFMGQPIPGYHRATCILSAPTARALVQMQSQLKPRGQTLVIFDCYRPQRAVSSFVQWAQTSGPPSPSYYPKVLKQNLIPEGYIAARSGHSRGSTVDLAIGPLVPATNPARRTSACGGRTDAETLDFGTPFDCFDPQSGNGAVGLSPDAIANRALLTTLMRDAGFRGYDAEWWHFTLRNEPFPDQWFDFPVR